VERWFAALTTRKLRRSAHRSVKALAADIGAWADTWNNNPTPFVWHKTADQIPRTARRLLRRHQRRRHRVTHQISCRFNLPGR
jgi:hypothetical protein